MELRQFKAVETPLSVEVWEAAFPVKGGGKRSREEEGRLEREGCGASASEVYDRAKRRQRYYTGVRWEIARLIECNASDGVKFLTLTFADNVTDVAYCNREFAKFVQRLNYAAYGCKEKKIHYLAVWERQKRGAIHYHLVLFGFPYMDRKRIAELWGFGFIRVNRVRLDRLANVGRYISKYFTKAADDDEGGKRWFCSRNLERPVVSRWTDEPMDAQSLADSFGGRVYFKEYDQVVPTVDGFAVRKVRYWKCAKEGGETPFQIGGSE